MKEHKQLCLMKKKNSLYTTVQKDWVKMLPTECVFVHLGVSISFGETESALTTKEGIMTQTYTIVTATLNCDTYIHCILSIG